MSDIMSDLDQLTPEELEKVGRLISKFANKEEVPKTRKRKGRGGKRKKPLDKKDQELIVEQQHGRTNRRRRILESEDDEIERPRQGRGRSQPRTQQRQNNGVRRGGKGRGRGKGRGNGGIMARTESVQLEGGNRFDKMRERNSERQDVEIDRKLWGKRQPSERSPQYEPVEAQCIGCNLWFDVNPGLVMIDPDTREPSFTCNNCSRTPRGEL